MVRKRETPIEEFRRIAERIKNQYPYIKTEEEFRAAFYDYMESSSMSDTQKKSLYNKTFNASISQLIGRDGKVRRRIIEQDVEPVTAPKIKRKRKQDEFDKVGEILVRSGDKRIVKAVFARETVFRRNSKKISRLRDRRGRFVRAIKK